MAKRMTGAKVGKRITRGCVMLRELCADPGAAAAVGRRVGVARSNMAVMLAGRYRPGTAVSIRIRDELGIPVEAWLEELAELARPAQPHVPAWQKGRAKAAPSVATAAE